MKLLLLLSIGLTYVSAIIQRWPPCITKLNAICVFPFTYKGVLHDKCTFTDTVNNQPWCATVPEVKLTRSGKVRNPSQIGVCNLKSNCQVEEEEKERRTKPVWTPCPGQTTLNSTAPLLLLPPSCTPFFSPEGSTIRAIVDPNEKEASFWWNKGQQFLNERVKRMGQDGEGVASNVIMFMGDGMGLPTMTAARWYKGQVTGNPRPTLTWDDWPGLSLARVFCVDVMVADSACSGTALSSGVKGNFFSAGVSGRVNNCQAQIEEAARQDVTSILQWAMEEGRSTGIITTTDITDASPAAFYAHIATRFWKNDKKVPAPGCDDIAMQMIRSHPGRDINVLLGKGIEHFIPESQGGDRNKDDLVREWTIRRDQSSRSDNYRFINKSSDMAKVDTTKTDFLLGLFEEDDSLNLATATKSAIEILSKNPKGFFLFVENEEIDELNHKNLAGAAMQEVIKLEDAVNAALDMTTDYKHRNMNQNNTLIVVTADHGHTLTITGYPERGQDILGNTRKDGNSILNYATGPGGETTEDNQDYENVADKVYPALHPSPSASHGGADVPVYAWGPGSEMFWGGMDQTHIPHIMGYSACIGPGRRNSGCAWGTPRV